jgi:general secretion pathway protein D
VVTTTNSSPIADALQEAAAQELLGARGGLFGLGFRAGNAIFGAIVNAVQRDNKSNLLATPVGHRDRQSVRAFPGRAGSAGDDGRGAFEQFRQCLPHGTAAECRHFARRHAADQCGDTVKLDIRQEVSSIAGTVGGRQSADLILNKREIETSIVVDDGDIIGIGGLLNDNERRRSRRSRSSATFRWSATSSSRAGGRARRPTSWSSSVRPSSARRPTRGR